MNSSAPKSPVDYELNVLRFYAGAPDTGVIPGADLNEAREFLIRNGYLNCAVNTLTPKGTALIAGIDDPDPAPAPSPAAAAPDQSDGCALKAGGVRDLPASKMSLDVWQAMIGGWALATFGPTPAQVHAARMTREMADVLDCVAIGDIEHLGRALAGVFVVGFALADSQGINIRQALLAEHIENSESHWVKDSWGQWVRRGDGSVTDTDTARKIAELVAADKIQPQDGVRLLMAAGAMLNQAAAFLIAHGGCHESDFQNAGIDDLTPRARGANLPLPKVYPIPKPAILTGDGLMIDDPAFAPTPLETLEPENV